MYFWRTPCSIRLQQGQPARGRRLGMTKRRKVLPRKRRDVPSVDDSLLLRSAESLGRVIGALQRQLDDATKRLSDASGDALDQFPSMREIKETLTPSDTSTKRRITKRSGKS